jgi:hypothetical protein
MMLEKMIGEAGFGGIYFFVGKKLLHEGHMTVGELYEFNKENDGFLYISYGESNPF